MNEGEILPPSLEPEVLPRPAAESNRSWMGTASLVLGIINMFAWCIPVCSGPMAIAGIILGALGLKAPNRGISIAGLVLNIIAILLSIIIAIIYASLWSSGWFENFFNSYYY